MTWGCGRLSPGTTDRGAPTETEGVSSRHLSGSRRNDAGRQKDVVYLTARAAEAFDAGWRPRRSPSPCISGDQKMWNGIAAALDPQLVYAILGNQAEMARPNAEKPSAHGPEVRLPDRRATASIPLPEAIEQSLQRSLHLMRRCVASRWSYGCQYNC